MISKEANNMEMFAKSRYFNLESLLNFKSSCAVVNPG